MTDRQPFSGIRSFLFVPGNDQRKLAKVFGVGADAVILDLEDAVAIAEKEDARATVNEALQSARSCLGYVRVNALGSGYCREDLEAVVARGVDGIVLPKVESSECLEAVDGMLAAFEERAGLEVGAIDLMPIVETALGVESAIDIVRSDTRVKRLSFGAGDYTLDLDYEWNADEAVLDFARTRLSHASRIGGLEPPIDAAVVQVSDDDRFLMSARRGRSFGFAGKLCIHPRQVTLCHGVFTPGTEELERARAIVAAFEAAEAAGSASVQLDGYFIDYPIVSKAQRTLALAERLEEQLEDKGG